MYFYFLRSILVKSYPVMCFGIKFCSQTECLLVSSFKKKITYTRRHYLTIEITGRMSEETI